MSNLVNIKAQLSDDPVDQYIMEHTFRPTPEQTELIAYTRSLPGRLNLSFLSLFVFIVFSTRKIRSDDRLG